MGKRADIEVLRDLLDPNKLDIKCALVVDLEVPNDRSVVLVTVNVLPEGFEMLARMSWDHVAPDAGIFQFPSKNDLVLVGFCDGHEDEAFVLRRLTSSEDKIPIQAVNGHLVLKGKSGTKAFLNSDTEINLTRENPGNERLVLGDTFRNAYSNHLDTDAKHKHIGNLGYFTAVPDLAADYQAIKSSPVDDDAMLSDLAKTEK